MAIEAVNSVMVDQTTIDQLNLAYRAKGGTSLDADDFLKLLAVQLQNQDPLSPMQDTQFIAQMASFTTLEQTKLLIKEIQTQGYASAASYIGKEVVIEDISSGQSVFYKGIVDSIFIEGGVTKVVVGGEAYDLSAIRSIANPAPEAPETPETTA
mgnify:CR=1 FL=1